MITRIFTSKRLFYPSFRLFSTLETELAEYYDYLKFEELQPKMIQLAVETVKKPYDISEENQLTFLFNRYLADYYSEIKNPDELFFIANFLYALNPEGDEESDQIVKTLLSSLKLDAKDKLRFYSLIYKHCQDEAFWVENLENFFYEHQSKKFSSEEVTQIFAIYSYLDSPTSDIIAEFYDKINMIRFSELSNYNFDLLIDTLAFYFYTETESFYEFTERIIRFTLSNQMKMNPHTLLRSLDKLIQFVPEFFDESDCVRVLLRVKNALALTHGERYLMMNFVLKACTLNPVFYERIKKRQKDFGEHFVLPSLDLISLFNTTNNKLAKIDKEREEDAQKAFIKLNKAISESVDSSDAHLVRLKVDAQNMNKVIGSSIKTKI